MTALYYHPIRFVVATTRPSISRILAEFHYYASPLENGEAPTERARLFSEDEIRSFIVESIEAAGQSTLLPDPFGLTTTRAVETTLINLDEARAEHPELVEIIGQPRDTDFEQRRQEVGELTPLTYFPYQIDRLETSVTSHRQTIAVAVFVVKMTGYWAKETIAGFKKIVAEAADQQFADLVITPTEAFYSSAIQRPGYQYFR